MENLSIELRTMARQNGLCNKWFGEWSDDCSDKELFDKYKKGIDFSIKTNWLSNDFIKSHWDKNLLNENNIFVDDIGLSLDNLKRRVIINGDSDITLNYDMYCVADIYIRNNSKVQINADDNCIVMVNLHDNANVTVNSKGNSRVNIFTHSDNCKVKNIGTKEAKISIGEIF